MNVILDIKICKHLKVADCDIEEMFKIADADCDGRIR